MARINDELESFGLALPDVLLPAANIDLKRWAVIACDQFTSEPEYWERVRSFVGNHPSTLDLILPEVYLNESDLADRVSKVHQAMRRYLAEGVLTEHTGTAVAVVRKGNADRGEGPGIEREGILFALDLEQYDFSPGSRSRIRATEQTIVERLPPRIRIRAGAPLELPHILVLVDDPERKIIEPTVAAARKAAPLYSTELMLGGGSITGYAVEEKIVAETLLPGLTAFADPARLKARYGRGDAPLLAVGDGNHSLASAKAVWENLKKTGNPAADHPARWALVEVLNLHSEALPIEPIHRIVQGIDTAKLVALFTEQHAAQTIITGEFDSVAELLSRADGTQPGELRFALGSGDSWHLLKLPAAAGTLTVTAVQEILDAFVASNTGITLDYIHGGNALARLAMPPSASGILLPPIKRNLLIPTVLERGTLPRKAFSLGEAEEKRYYMEARVIDPDAATRA